MSSSPTKNTCLPILGKEDPTRTLNKQIDKEYERGDIDREVENVKSAWQMLREENYWAKGKDRIDNARTKKLYEMLEKMTCEIDRVQKSYKDPKANHYLRKSANSVLRTSSKPSLQEEAEILRSVIFPDRKARTKSAISRPRNVDSEIIDKDMARVRFDEAAENILTDKQPRKNLLSKYTTKKRSVHTDANKHNIANDARSIHTIASETCNKKRDAAVTDIAKPTFADGNKTRARIKSVFEEYLQRCICNDNIHKSRSIEEEERSLDIEPSASDIADILASHNIGSRVFYENFERRSDGYDSDDYPSENDKDRSCSNTATTVTQVTSVDTIQENRKIRGNTSFENMGYNDTPLTKAIDARAFDTRTQSSVTNCQDNAFIEMGLNKNLPRDRLSQMLQSEYLRKGLSL
ncbi:uncharacterized protein [Temnothorax nylanderi]|uniref:uncharacterized protein n=1 Tax=Temnothorax nylanderi TaxID=102681 RepID=UPI003A896B57